MIWDDEEWREVREAPRYLVSNFGRVYDYERDCLLTQTPDGGGYLRVKMWVHGVRRSMSVHRLVASLFLGNSLLEVNHDDGDKTYNYVSNLEWTTRSENMKHAYNNGWVDVPKRFPMICVETGEEYKSSREAARELDISCHKLVIRVLDNPDRSIHGFHFVTKRGGDA